MRGGVATGRRVRAALGQALVLGAALLLTSCFEEPVEERLTLAFEPDGMFELRVVTTISNSEGEDSAPALTRRLAETRRAFEGEYDPWARRFELLEPDYEKVAFERDHGILARVERTGSAGDHEKLRRFFADANLSATVTVTGREAEFLIIPGGAGRASRAQRDRVARLLVSWSEAVARTYAATEKLYAYLDEHPDRTRACLSALFAEALRSDDQRVGRTLTDEDQAALADLREARKEVLEIFEVPEDEAYSFNELSHLAYDPFPARLAVTIPGEPREVEGFDLGADGALVVSGLGLYEALETLGGVWATPDPLVTYVQAARTRGEKLLSLEALAEGPLAAASPRGDEVREAIEERLRPAPVYRVVFGLGGAAGEESDDEASPEP